MHKRLWLIRIAGERGENVRDPATDALLLQSWQMMMGVVQLPLAALEAMEVVVDLCWCV